MDLGSRMLITSQKSYKTPNRMP